MRSSSPTFCLLLADCSRPGVLGSFAFSAPENVREVARQIPADRLLVETDAPYLAPVPYRGKPNQPAYVIETARFLAELRGVPYEQLRDETGDNFFRLFSRAAN